MNKGLQIIPKSLDGIDAILPFAALVTVLTIPLWIVSAHFAAIAPGLPLAAAAVVCPGLAAWIVTRLTRGQGGVLAWWQHARAAFAGSFGSSLLAAALPIGVAAVSLLFTRKAEQQVHMSAAVLLAFIPLTLIGAWLEEAGWSAFAGERLLKVWPLLPAALLVGLLWALWHVIPLLQVGRSVEWILWWALGTVCMRVVMLWLYVRGGHRINGPLLFHAADNVCWQASLSFGMIFDPRVHALLMGAVVAALWAFRAVKN